MKADPIQYGLVLKRVEASKNRINNLLGEMFRDVVNKDPLEGTYGTRS